MQRYHPITERLTHTSNLAIPSLREDDAKSSPAESSHGAGTSESTEHHHPFRHPPEKRLVEFAVHLHPVFPFMPMLHPEDVVDDIPVIRQQDQAGRIFIEAPDRKDPSRVPDFSDDVPP